MERKNRGLPIAASGTSVNIQLPECRPVLLSRRLMKRGDYQQLGLAIEQKNVVDGLVAHRLDPLCTTERATCIITGFRRRRS